MKRVLLAAPRSFCAGVDRAIEIVERLLAEHGPPIYVRHQLVHNDHVVRRLEGLGAVFVDSEDEIPAGEICVLSAHGVAPAVRENCERRGLRVVDAVCPLVSKVHAEARRYADSGHLGVGHQYSGAFAARRPASQMFQPVAAERVFLQRAAAQSSPARKRGRWTRAASRQN